MTVIIEAPDPDDPERILAFGGPGVGKSKGAISIASHIGNDKTMFVLDNDFAYKRMNSKMKLQNLEIQQLDIDDWEKTMATIKAFSAEAQPSDWLNIDGMTPPWMACQNAYCVKTYGMDMELYFAKRKREGTDSPSGFDGNDDYKIINPMWNKFLKEIFNFPGHVYMTAEMEPMNDKEKDPVIKGLFGPVGVKPRGQKRVPHIPHTILLFSRSRAGGHFMTTIKDRERDQLDQEEFDDFAMDYLRLTAGWKEVKAA